MIPLLVDTGLDWPDFALFRVVRPWVNVVLIFGQRHKRWTSIKPALAKPFSAGTVFTRQNLTSTDVSFWRQKSIPALKELKLEGSSFFVNKKTPLQQYNHKGW